MINRKEEILLKLIDEKDKKTFILMQEMSKEIGDIRFGLQEKEKENLFIRMSKNKEVEHFKNEILLKEKQINALKNSTSWKITKPIRICSDFVKKILILTKKSFLVIKRDGIVKFIKKVAAFLKIKRSSLVLKNKIIFILAKAFVVYKKEGVGVLIKKTILFLRKKNLQKNSETKENSLGVFEKMHFYNNDRLTISVFVPFDFSPNNFGGAMRIMNIYEALSNHFNINLIGIKGHDDFFDVRKINDNLTTYLVPMGKEFYNKLITEQQKFKVPLHDVLLINNYKLIPILTKLFDYLNIESDVLISSHPYFFNLFKDKKSNKILVYEAHNVDYDLKKAYFGDSKLLMKYLKEVEDIESFACEKSNIVLTVSENDKKNLLDKYKFDKKKVIIVPNGIDVFSCKNKRAKNKIINNNRPEVVFVGSLHKPNIEAIDFIINDLAKKDIGIKYTIIGNTKEFYSKKGIPKNVDFVGMISESKKIEIYQRCDAVINPMFSGSGTNLKVIEYAAYQIPIISTEFGMRGLEVLNKNVYIANKQNFYLTIKNVISLDLDIKIKNSKQARKICEDNFDKNIIIKNIFEEINYFKDTKFLKKPQNIFIEGRILERRVSGTERYIYEILKNIKNSATEKEFNYFLINNSSLNVLKYPSIPLITKETPVDLYHRTYQIGHEKEIKEMFFSKKNIITFHDLILCKYPEYFDTQTEYQKYVSLMELSLRMSDRIIAISEHAKRDIIETFNMDEDKIDVIYHGIDLEKFKQIIDVDLIKNFKKINNLPDKYMLYIGTNYPHKNLKNLYLAFEDFVKRTGDNDYYLVVAGNNYYKKSTDFLDSCSKSTKERIIDLGHFPDSDINLLYSGAEIFVFPSLYEGFGFPVLEAFACGVPVICSNATSLPEVAGDAAVLVNAYNFTEISEAMINLTLNEDKRRELTKKGLERASFFTWNKTIQKTILSYKKTLSNVSIEDKASLIKDNKFNHLFTNKDKKELLMLAEHNKIKENGIPRLVVLFLQYDTKKYKDSFKRFYKKVEKIKNFDKKYIIIDNKNTEIKEQDLNSKVKIINGNNEYWEFSGWQKGIDFLKEKGIDCDAVLFANDSFYVNGWNFLDFAEDLNLLDWLKKENSVIGQIDTKGVFLQAFGKDVSSWVCTNSFLITKKTLSSLKNLVQVDKNVIREIISDKYNKDFFLKNNLINDNYKKMLINWLTREWHGKFEINESTWEKFIKKTLSILNESMLSSFLKEQGYKLESYKEYLVKNKNVK